MNFDKHKDKHTFFETYLRDIVFGVEDGVVSTVGFLAGLAGAAIATKALIIVAGLAEIFAAAISMGAGTYLASKSVRDYYLVGHHKRQMNEEDAVNPIAAAIAIFIPFVIGALLLLVPYYIFPVTQALLYAIVIALVELFAFGAAKSYFTKLNWFKSGMEMLLIGAFAAGSGYVIGILLKGLTSLM